jgi:hypothetical protein
MQLKKQIPALLAFFLTACMPAAAQLTPAEPDPLARIRDAAAGSVQACSATGENLCEQVAPKIIANAQGDSPLAENLRRLKETLAEKSGSVSEEHAVAWAMAAFRQAGLEPHVEKYANPKGGADSQINVVAEYRGREKSDEWVLVGAHLGQQTSASDGGDNSCDAASVVEAARDISLTAMHPKRSIRFVLFTGNESATPSSWAYLRSHRAELDRARVAILVHSNCQRVTGFWVNGRHDLESGLREAMKPAESLEANRLEFDATAKTDDLDFLLEGLPTLSARPLQPGSDDSASPGREAANVDLADLKRNIAVVAVTAFGVAERTAPIGPRQTHVEIQSLLIATGLNAQMKSTEAWKQWESGERGRLP